MVLALGMSRPFSTIVVDSSTSYLCATKSSIVRSSASSPIWPWPTTTRASGTSRCEQVAPSSRSTRRGCARSRPGRRAPAPCAARAPITAWSNFTTCVWIDSRSLGGVSITDMSRMPTSDMLSVRGIGVAVSVSTSTLRRICLMRSLWATPKRCSSSTTSRPRSRNCDVLRQQAVGADEDVELAAGELLEDRRLLGLACGSATPCRRCTGNDAKRARSVSRCWNASTVVGARIATCLPSITALNAARSATSVLP